LKRLTKRIYLVLILATLTAMFSFAFAYQYPAILGSVTVREPISITPPIMNLAAWPNERLNLNFTINNAGTKSVTLVVNATVIQTPPGGNLTDITFISPQPFDAIPGANTATVVAVVDNGAVPGVYQIQAVFCRLSQANQRCG